MKSEKCRFFERNNGPFWYVGDNKSKIEKKISHLLQLRKKRWLSLLHKEIEEINFDPKNYHIKKFVNNLCSKFQEEQLV